jgi:hypothetical protein
MIFRGIIYDSVYITRDNVVLYARKCMIYERTTGAENCFDFFLAELQHFNIKYKNKLAKCLLKLKCCLPLQPANKEAGRSKNITKTAAKNILK